MVFAAVPKDVTIEKLTAPEKRALDEYLGKETKKSIWEQIAGNEKVPSLIAGGVILASAPTILRLIFEALQKGAVDMRGSCCGHDKIFGDIHLQAGLF